MKCHPEGVEPATIKQIVLNAADVFCKPNIGEPKACLQEMARYCLNSKLKVKHPAEAGFLTSYQLYVWLVNSVDLQAVYGEHDNYFTYDSVDCSWNERAQHIFEETKKNYKSDLTLGKQFVFTQEVLAEYMSKIIPETELPGKYAVTYLGIVIVYKRILNKLLGPKFINTNKYNTFSYSYFLGEFAAEFKALPGSYILNKDRLSKILGLLIKYKLVEKDGSHREKCRKYRLGKNNPRFNLKLDLGLEQ